MAGNGPIYTEQFMIKATDVGKFLDECQTLEGLDITGTRIIQTAMKFQNRDNVYATEVDMEPFPRDKPGDPYGYDTVSALGTYSQFYLATVTYSPPPVGTTPTTDDSDPTDVSYAGIHEMSGGGQAITILPEQTPYYNTGYIPSLDESGVISATDRAAMGQRQNFVDKNKALAKAIPTIEHNVTLPKQGNPDWEFIGGLLGTVNDGDKEHLFSAIWPRFRDAWKRPYTILYSSFTARPVYKVNEATWTSAEPDQIEWYEIKMRFSEKLIPQTLVTDIDPDTGKLKFKDVFFGWNHVWNDQQKAWVWPIVGANQAMYKASNFKLLTRTIPQLHPPLV